MGKILDSLITCGETNVCRFTWRGTVAFIFSTLMGVFGVYVVASYGLRTDGKKKKNFEREPLLASGDVDAASMGRSVGDGVVSRR